jgi:hypothetical protein
MGETARRLPGGVGGDHVIEVGGPATLEQSMAATRVQVHIALTGILTGLDGSLSLIAALVEQLRMQGRARREPAAADRYRRDRGRSTEAGDRLPLPVGKSGGRFPASGKQPPFRQDLHRDVSAERRNRLRLVKHRIAADQIPR